MDSSPTDIVEPAPLAEPSSEVVMAVPKSRKTMLDANIRFSKGVKVDVGYSERTMVKVVLEADLLDNGLELFC